MSFKQGIPLLDAFEEDDEKEEDEYDPSYTKRYVPKRKFPVKAIFNKKMAVIVGITFLVSLVLLSILITTALVVIHHLPSQERTVELGEVTKSELDTREYKAIVLPNKLRVLLVSDNETDESAAAMDVAVGSFSNPKEYQGLAHFCEHMLFYANEKYPEEGAYADFLSSHGGYDNAYTSTQNTNYHFKVNPDNLMEALDRFAQFFISPIFSADAVSREVNAVDAEHRKNLQNDGWRQWQLLKHVSNQDHPFHLFSTGDLETLDKPGVLESLKEFYSSHYSANEMQLVIYGKENMATLVEYAENIFSPIPNRNVVRPSFAPNTSFPDGYNGKIVYFIPVANRNSLSVFWQVPPLLRLYREQSSQFINYLLGNEGHGSIIDSLRRNNWAFDITADVEVDTDTYTLLVVDVTLTELGLKHVSDVIGTVMQYIHIVSSSDQQLQDKWNDFVRVQSINFKYAGKDDPDSFVSTVSHRMGSVLEPSDFLLAPSRFYLNTSAVEVLVSCLKPSKAVIFVGSKVFANTSLIQESTVPLNVPSSLSKVEPIYGTKYQIVDISQSLVAYWTTYNVKSPLNLPLSIKDFLPQNFSLLPPPNPAKDSPTNLDIRDGDGISVWWFQDTYYNRPKVNIYCDINSAMTQYSLYDPQWTAFTALYTTLVATVLKADIYAGSLVDITVDLDPTPHGINLQIQGYSDSSVMERFVEIISNALHNESLLGDQNMFSLARESLLNDLRNYNFTALPYRYTYQYIQSVVMDRPKWMNWQLMAVLENDTATTAQALLDHMQLLLTKSTLLCFVHGNVQQTEAQTLSNSILKALKSHALPSPHGQVYGWRVNLTAGNYSVIVPVLNPEDKNSVVNVVFQIGKKCDVVNQMCSKASLRRTALLGLLTLIMKQSCFDVLRSQLQLGYVAYCTNRVNENIYSFQVLVQSGTRNASDILQSIDSFLLSYSDMLSDRLSSSGSFDELVSSFVDGITVKPLTLSDATDVYWSQIQSGLEQFDFIQQVVNATRSLKVNDLFEFYNLSIIDYTKAKKLAVVVYGSDKRSSLDTAFQHDIDYLNLNPKARNYPPI